MVSCSNNKQEDSKKEIPHHNYNEVIDKTIIWSDTFKLSDNDYCVYYFSKICDYCEEARDEVIDIALTRKMPIYFCSEGGVITDRSLIPESTIGIDNILYLKIKGFPSVINIKNSKISSHYAGKSQVLNFLRNVN